jgi:hypothetical protein
VLLEERASSLHAPRGRRRSCLRGNGCNDYTSVYRYIGWNIDVWHCSTIPTQLYTKCGKLRFEPEIDR